MLLLKRRVKIVTLGSTKPTRSKHHATIVALANTNPEPEDHPALANVNVDTFAQPVQSTAGLKFVEKVSGARPQRQQETHWATTCKALQLVAIWLVFVASRLAHMDLPANLGKPGQT